MQVKELDEEQIERLKELFDNPEKQIVGIAINKDLNDEVTLVVEYNKGNGTQSAII